MVGLPARGKTYISYKVSRYLAWLGVNCRVFNVGEYRRKLVGAKLDHSFFDPYNAAAIDQRLKCAMMALHDMFKWFGDVHSGVAVYDATNTTRSRRKMILDECNKHDVEVMFCESWCDDNDLIDMNIREVKRTSPDYKGVKDIESVMADFRRRIDHYGEVYEPLGGDGTRPLAKGAYPLPPTNPTLEDYNERQVSFLRKINVGSRMVINRITSYLESRIVYFIMNIHIATRSVLFSRHGESMYNLDQRLGGDPSLSPNGKKYAEALPSLISKLLGDQPLTVWTSTLKRTSETAAGLPYKKMQWKALDELDAGLCDGLTYEDVEREYPDEYAMRDENKFEFRYRGGESYRDVVLRLEPVIMELERQQNIMIVSHQAVLRCIYAYFLDIGPDELPYLKIPLHTVMKLTWTAYGCDIQMYKIDIDAVDTHRAKPKAVKRGGILKSSSTNGSANASIASPAKSQASSSKLPLESDTGLSPAPAEIDAVGKGFVSTIPTSVTEDKPSINKVMNEPLEVTAAKRAMAQNRNSPNVVSDTWDVDEVWSPTGDVAQGRDIPLPTPPTTNAPPSVQMGSSPVDKSLTDPSTIKHSLQENPALQQQEQPLAENSVVDQDKENTDVSKANVITGVDFKGVQSKLSVFGGHDQGMSCDGHHMGHVWPSQISPSISRASSRAPSPTFEDEDKAAKAAASGISQLGIDTEGARAHANHSFPRRSNPRNGSPVYLSPGDFAMTFEMHSMESEATPIEAPVEIEQDIAAVVPPGAQTVKAGSPALSQSLPVRRAISTSSRHSPQVRQPLLANQKIDELHVAGHGSVDVVETTPTVTLRYSSDLPAAVRKQTKAMKNELVGIEDEESNEDDSSSERGGRNAATACTTTSPAADTAAISAAASVLDQ
ncbi:Fructose-2,6-bisphosphatase [Coemansia spiralis]|uniref:fructose-2,6-bisphosphate 2-phosphatase n=2 Tax=Coemansia TaxID=4863 RepID=A0A9W8G3Z1_9FUNG|nr:Fructose-2,6-bisphosphatase [Coemansia spiralis]